MVCEPSGNSLWQSQNGRVVFTAPHSNPITGMLVRPVLSVQLNDRFATKAVLDRLAGNIQYE